MSYDISIGPMDRNMTSNVSRLWDRAMPDLNLRDMNGKTGAACYPHLRDGAEDMARNRHSYEDMMPDTTWGSYGGALAVLVEMAAACRDHPDQIVSVHC